MQANTSYVIGVEEICFDPIDLNPYVVIPLKSSSVSNSSKPEVLIQGDAHSLIYQS